jgi:pimeloyl-ACP methyl ester carboxylesterase
MANVLVNQLLFKPPKNHTYEFSHSIIRLTTQTGDEIAATFVRKKGAHVTILFSHGNAEDLNTCFQWLRRLSRELNVNMIAYDYPGYGESSGEQDGTET